MLKINSYIPFWVLFLLFFTMSAQEGELIFNSVEETINYAIENNNNLENARLDQEIVERQIAEIKGRALPQIDGTAGFSDNFSLQEQILPAEIFGGEPGTTVNVAFGNRYQYTAGVNARQELLNFRLLNSIQSVQALENLRELETLLSTQDLIINVVQTYIQVQVSEKEIELLQQNVSRTANLVELQRKRYEEGIVKKLDLNQLLVNLSNIEIQLEDAIIALNQQFRLLKVLLNVPMDTKVVLQENLADRAAYPFEKGFLLDQNLEYQQLQQSIDLSLIDEDLIKAEYLPTLAATFGYNYLGQSNEFVDFDPEVYQGQWNGNWGLALSIPIFDGFQRRNRLKQREIETEKLENQQTTLRLNLEKDYRDALDRLMLSNSQIESQDENMQLAQENYDGINLSYNEGVANLTELLDAEFALRQAQSNYLNALLQSRVAEITLLKTSGKLSQLITNPQE